jgi:hypothetical protein
MTRRLLLLYRQGPWRHAATSGNGGISVPTSPMLSLLSAYIFQGLNSLYDVLDVGDRWSTVMHNWCGKLHLSIPRWEVETAA